MNTLHDAIAAAVKTANECGLRGQKVNVSIISPQTPTQEYSLVVHYLPRGSPSQG